ncbi:MAG: hypothetical protein Fur0025_02010 [Oscillatoriaceae cyanobacterium]
MSKLVVLKFEQGNFEEGFKLTLRIGEDSDSLREALPTRPSTVTSGRLPKAPEIPNLYERWQSYYKQEEVIYKQEEVMRGISTQKGESIKTSDIPKQFSKAAEELKTHTCNWLKSETAEWQKIRKALIDELKDENEEIRVLIQAGDPLLKRLPWQEWDLFDTYTNTEIAISPLEYQRVKPAVATTCRNKIRILAILGDTKGIDIQPDIERIQNLPDAEPIFLKQPQREELYRKLRDYKGWDILFFAGHSKTEAEKGRLYINSNDSLRLDELKKALNKAIKHGLKLAIFNSCDGLGLAEQLADWNIPQVIVMREPVPDQMAQKFLSNFINAFASGDSLYTAVREAREMLEAFQDKFPGVMWLPIICQNPAESPQTWQGFLERTYGQEITLTREELRQRTKLLGRVKNYWIKGVLERSLHDRIPIQLGLEEWENPEERRQTLPPGTRVIDRFDKMGSSRTLLILGEPGAGKTITLLELARELIARAEQYINQPVPVVLNLSTWANKKQTITDWVIDELISRYQVSASFARTWMEKEQLLLLLDGLDEVSAEFRGLCLQALNQFSEEHGQIEIAVTSRIGDYKALSQQLRFQVALCVQPLTPEQIYQYLVSLGAGMEAVKTALQEDSTLLELAKSPLMLNIMCLAYQGMVELPAISDSEQRRHHLFSVYIERMLHRRQHLRRYGDREYDRSLSLHWLAWLAERMSREYQTIFSIEQLQPTWLTKTLQKQMPVGVGVIFGLTVGLILLGIIWITFSLVIGDFYSLIVGSIIGVIFGLGVGLWACLTVGRDKKIEPVETLNLSGETAKKALILGPISGLITWLILRGFGWLIFRTGDFPLAELIFSIIFGSIFGLIFEIPGRKIGNTTIPNQAIWQSVKNAAILTGVASGGMGVVAGLTSRQILEIIVGQAVAKAQIGTPWMQQFTLRAILAGMVLGLIFGLTQAGTATIQHFTLRVILWWHNCAPWNYSRFLDYAADRIFLQKVGGSYIFIHRLLQEHFAGLTSKPAKSRIGE